MNVNLFTETISEASSYILSRLSLLGEKFYALTGVFKEK